MTDCGVLSTQRHNPELEAGVSNKEVSAKESKAKGALEDGSRHFAANGVRTLDQIPACLGRQQPAPAVLQFSSELGGV